MMMMMETCEAHVSSLAKIIPLSHEIHEKFHEFHETFFHKKSSNVHEIS
jgi:hypothetical protein